MLKAKSYQKRASSAGSTSQKKHRILSAKPLGQKNKRIHTQSYDAGYETVKPTRSRLLTSGMQHYRFADIATKGPEELVEQNLHLKVQLKDLNAKLNLTRTKIESQKKKHLMYSRKLNREFEKQLYWTAEKGQDYLITGIKHQYEKVKQTLQQKCSELQMVRQTVSYSNIKELTAYCESLEVENKILIENIAYLKKKKRRTSSVDDNNAYSQFAHADLEYLINEQRKKDQINQAKIKSLQQQINKQAHAQKQHIKKIQFLEKLIIEKQNESYHMSKNMKAIERQKNKIANELKTFQTKLLEKQSEHLEKFNQFKQKADRQAKIEKTMFQKAIKEKTLMVQKLQKQIAYLSTLLSYWKPLDELDRFDLNNSSQKSHKEKSMSLNLNQSMSLHGTTNRQMVRSKTPLNLNIDEEYTSNDERLIIRASQKEDAISRRDSSLHTIQRQESDKFSKADGGANRQPRRSTKKWSEDAKKRRRVQFTEVQYLGELIRFKMIAAQKPLGQVREYFSCKLPKGLASKLDQDLITMREVIQTLTKAPFSLSPTQAQLLSRYIIEDPAAEYVYSHEGNELQRAIVKSIVKTIVGQYELPNSQNALQKWNQIKKVYSHNMQLALKSICPKGTVSKNKFLELMNSLGIEADQETKNYVIAKMVENSTTLAALPYDLLFQVHETIN